MTALSAQDLACVSSAYRIRLKKNIESGDLQLMQFAVPAPLTCVRETITAAEFVAHDARAKTSEDVILVVAVLESGANLATDSAWMVSMTPPLKTLSIDPAIKDDMEQPADLTMRSDRIIWRAGRALMVCSQERVTENLIALAYFSYFVEQVKKIEQQLAQGWTTLRRHMPLNHQVSQADLVLQPQVNEKTVWATNLRADFASIDPFVDAVPSYMPTSARRMVQELVNHCELVPRMAALDDQLEVFEDVYESANDRLLEFSYYAGEFKLEVIIIFVLLIELAFMAAEYFL